MIVNNTKAMVSILLIFIVSCSAHEGKEETFFREKKVDKISVFLQADSSSTIAGPSWIKSVSGGFLLYDAILEKISRFDMEGQHLLSFGNEGRGPGEFQSPGDLWKFDDRYLIYDNNSNKFVTYDSVGNHVEDVSLDFVEFPGNPASIEALSPQRFIMPSGGKGGSLFKLVDLNSETAQYIGEAVSEEFIPVQSPDERRQAISSGDILAMYKNDVLLSSNETGIFSFQQATAILEKYDGSGELIWQKDVKVPAIDGLFEKLFKENRARMESGEMLLAFAYADGISANEKGVAIKLNLFEGQSVVIVWVSNGGDLTVVTFPELKKTALVPLIFTIADDESYILFANTLEGKIDKADWPL